MESTTPSQVDIVIPTRNRGALIEPAISSIRACTDIDFRLWIIDQSDDDRTAASIAPYAAADARICYIHSSTRGASIARNLGAGYGEAPYILFTDDDCRVDPGWIAGMLAELTQPDVWAVFGRILPERRHDGTAHPVQQGVSLATKFDEDRIIFQHNRFNLGFGHGASMGIKREVFAQIGGFDALLGAGAVLRSWEDRDVGFRILSGGGKIVYTPAALLYHNQWRDWPGINRAFADYGIGAGATAAKFLRYGDLGGAVLLFEWFFSQGIRQALSGLIKWRSPRKIILGLLQLYYPWVGLWQSMHYPLSQQHRVYLPRSDD